ncbi:hypothetical protein AMS62_12225 [Bacillus sp. FJAT-18019]|nr:hypothetical protein AMS62_12225 [Bacillus sp. FJAT-18019]
MEEFINRFCPVDNEKADFFPTFHNDHDLSVRSYYKPVIEHLFGHSIERGADSIIFGGSFITNDETPNDIDCIVIVPNSNCIPHKNEILTMSGCTLDIVYVTEENTDMIYKLMNMFSFDKYDLNVGLVQVSLTSEFRNSWDDFYGQYDFAELLLEREAYISRHFVTGSQKNGVLVTIHGLNTNSEWNFDLSPIASSSNWIFAPFYYGNVKLPLLSQKLKADILEYFREWIFMIKDKYQCEISIFAHSFGTYIIGAYLAGFNYNPPVKFDNIVLAGSILSPDYDWNTCIDRGCVNTVYNIVSPRDPWVPKIEGAKILTKDKLYGQASNLGFTQTNKRLIQESYDIYDHSNMLRLDVFESKVIPFLNTVKKFR